MERAGRERGKEIGKRRAEDGKRKKMQKDVKNRGNKLKDALQTKHLAVFRTKNRPKTNSILSAKSANQSEKTGCKCKVSSDRNPVLEARG
jgi:hypothetical protein